MSAQKLKATVGQLERKRTKRHYVVRRLQEEHDQLLLHSKAIDLLVQHQDTMARMLHRYYQPCTSPPTSIADDTGLLRPLLFQDWPMMAGLKAMQLSDYNWLFGVTPQQVGECVVHYLQNITVAVNRIKANSSSSSSLGQQQQADMDKAVGDLLLLTKAIYILTPGVMTALKDVNLMTGQLEPPPDSHWEHSFIAMEASLEQLALMEEVLQQVVPCMQRLDEERQGLAECINSVKALTLKEQSAAAQQLLQQLHEEEQQRRHEEEEQQRQQQRQRQQQQQARGRVGASCAAGLREAAVQQVAAVTAAARSAMAWVKIEQAEPHVQANGRHHSHSTSARSATKHEPAAMNGFCTSVLQQNLEAACPAESPKAAAAAAVATVNGCNGKSEGSETSHQASDSHCHSTGATSISAGALRYMRGTCKDMVADMDRWLLKWRIVSGARSAVCFVLRPEQLAAMALAAFPYFPMMGCLLDYLPAARAAAEQRQQQQKQQQQMGP